LSQDNKNLVLLKRIKENDEEALEELVEENMGLVKSIVMRFRDRGVEYEDLVQIGSIGMIKAARSFEFSFNNAFSTYAVPLITGEILRYLRDDGPIKVSRSIKSKATAVMRARDQFIKSEGREPRISELSEKCGIDVEEIGEIMEACTPVYSLSDSVGGDPDGLKLSDVIPDGENEIEKMTDRIALSEALMSLSGIQREIVRLRYYRNLSQQMTGQILGLSQVKVSREEKKIISILKTAL
jgi:RNA polymerase sporulation-specific sigma factor